MDIFIKKQGDNVMLISFRARETLTKMEMVKKNDFGMNDQEPRESCCPRLLIRNPKFVFGVLVELFDEAQDNPSPKEGN